MRDARKGLVKRIEAELEDLGRWKIEVWETQVPSSNASGAAPDLALETVLSSRVTLARQIL